MSERPRGVPAVYLTIERDGKNFAFTSQDTNYHDRDWTMPSGHDEADKLSIEAMIRETEEEIGIRLEKENLEFEHVMYRGTHDKTGERVDFFFAATH